MDLNGSPLEIQYELIDSAEKLPENERNLLEKAYEAGKSAYAPFSGFHVGCALLLENGEIISGNNQENKAYPSSLCAERVALYHAGSQEKADQVRFIAIRASSESKPVLSPPTPCGACRQVMLEYENLAGKPFTVLMQGDEGKILKIKGISGGLLPFAFDIDF